MSVRDRVRRRRVEPPRAPTRPPAAALSGQRPPAEMGAPKAISAGKYIKRLYGATCSPPTVPHREVSRSVYVISPLPGTVVNRGGGRDGRCFASTLRFFEEEMAPLFILFWPVSSASEAGPVSDVVVPVATTWRAIHVRSRRPPA